MLNAGQPGGSDPIQVRERRLVLASGSPRRRLLLEQIGFHPYVHPAKVEEVLREGETPEQYTRRLSQTKARLVAEEVAGWKDTGMSPWVLAADTVVVTEGAVLEKPRDAIDACRKLRALSGRWHTVVTAYCVHGIGHPWRSETEAVTPEVLVKDLSDSEIHRYVATGDPMDKAGAYGIQGLGSFLVRELKGSYFAVMGLPVCEVVETLLELGAIRGFPFHPGVDWR